MPRLFGITLRLLMSISWKASSRILQLFYFSLFFVIFLKLRWRAWASKFPYFTSWKESAWCSFFNRVFLGSKFPPSLICNGSREVLFLYIRNCTQFSAARKNFPSTRCATAAIWYVVAQIYLLSKLGLTNRFYASSTFRLTYGFII